MDEELISEGIPPWILLAGPHGEFELLFTIPAYRIEKFLLAAKETSWEPICIGNAIKEAILKFPFEGLPLQIQPYKISNLYHECGENVQQYLCELLKINESWIQKTTLQN